MARVPEATATKGLYLLILCKGIDPDGMGPRGGDFRIPVMDVRHTQGKSPLQRSTKPCSC